MPEYRPGDAAPDSPLAGAIESVLRGHQAGRIDWVNPDEEYLGDPNEWDHTHAWADWHFDTGPGGNGTPHGLAPGRQPAPRLDDPAPEPRVRPGPAGRRQRPGRHPDGPTGPSQGPGGRRPGRRRSRPAHGQESQHLPRPGSRHRRPRSARLELPRGVHRSPAVDLGPGTGRGQTAVKQARRPQPLVRRRLPPAAAPQDGETHTLHLGQHRRRQVLPPPKNAISWPPPPSRYSPGPPTTSTR